MTEAEKERLAMLAEEAGEIVQIVGKILRHGYENYHPNDAEKITNREHLFQELRDLDGVIYGMQQSGDLPTTDVESYHNDIKKSWQKKLKWSYHQEKNDD